MAETREHADVIVEPWLARHPAVGLAVAVVRDGRLAVLHTHGLADIASRRPIDAGTVFRVGSITKPFTAIAVMQLYEQGRLDLDAPAACYLRSYRLVAARPGGRRPTVRHLLTHTAGIPEVRHLSDLLHPEAGPFGGRPPIHSVPFGESMPSLAEHLRAGLRPVSEPGIDFAYSNLGFATLGQIVEDVSGVPLAGWFRERIFEPLGMADTGLVRSGRLAARLATGYAVGRHGPYPVPDRDWIGAGCGGIYSTAPDLARFAAALSGGGANEHGRVLAPATLTAMAECQFTPDPRLPGWGLGFARAEAGGHLLIGHDGILPGFNTTLWAAPDGGPAVVALTNGSPGAFGWMEREAKDLLRELLGAPPDTVRAGIAHRPEIWRTLCGRYRLRPRISDLRGRLALPGGVEVFARGGRLMIRALTPVPALRRGVPLHPDDPDDPYVFRVDLTDAGQGTFRVVFGRDLAGGGPALHADLGGQPVTLIGRSAARPDRAGAARTAAVAAFRRPAHPAPEPAALIPAPHADLAEIPASHADLAECPPVAALTTLMPDGTPQTSVVWCDRDGEFVRVNTMLGFRKERNIRRDPRVTLLCYDPQRPGRYLEIRGRVAETTRTGAGAHLDELASKYLGRPVRYFGDVVPAALAATETPMLCRIRPGHVVAADGPDGGGPG
ncbi:TIGR03618 family F420-dependent PPOX class oxidoreductase [Actinoplanes sp. KI2]|uniref:TIGR03618 family F420-dependent PPOX class oxidoreductase n=1 Tax=Actinoplanes sp. KI2 TaxID=2983315 RepID=UPI0021D613BC|nr:TIGR03618 family F420-dependent PPOX class oxidoreductase [Actinoplanes sp. KI2]MCU7728185.1 TIGR03618 family F420-dependent PPOX class oxidoreductase [Actinoplanes sp. KI2]